MERGYQALGKRANLGGADYDDYSSYDRLGRVGGGYLDRSALARESLLGRSSGSSYLADRSGYLESLLEQRALQRQLSIRESQLALATTSLQMMNNRRMDQGFRGYRDDFTRPRLMDNRSRPRNRMSGGRESGAGSRSPRGGSDRRQYQSAPRGQGRSSGTSTTSKNKTPTGNNKETGNQTAEKSGDQQPKETKTKKGISKFFCCKTCNIEFKNEDEVWAHRSSAEHRDRRVQEMRDKQVRLGCKWCKVTTFKDFSEVLEHRATEKHIMNQTRYGKDDSKLYRQYHGSGGTSNVKRKSAVNVDMPPELSEFDPKVTVGQTSVVAVTGWFCKLCNKFYNNETTAKETHCMTVLHFRKYKTFMYTKLKAEAEAERDAKEKAEEEERKKKEAEAAEKKEGEETTEPSSEQQETDTQEESTDTQDQQEGGKEMEVGENGDGADQEEEGDVKEEEATAGEQEEGGEDKEGEGEEMMEEEDDEEVTAAEDSVCQVTEEAMAEEEGEGDKKDEEDEGEEEVEESTQKEAPQAAVSSPGRGRGRGGNRARRGRRVAK